MRQAQGDYSGTLAIQDASGDMATYRIASVETPQCTRLQADSAETYGDVPAMNQSL